MKEPRVKFDLTEAQSRLVQPLVDQLKHLNLEAFADGKEMDGATITGQLMLLIGHDTPTVLFALVDRETSAQLLEALNAGRKRRDHEHQA